MKIGIAGSSMIVGEALDALAAIEGEKLTAICVRELWSFERRNRPQNLPNAPTNEARNQALYDVLQSGTWVTELKKAAA